MARKYLISSVAMAMAMVGGMAVSATPVLAAPKEKPAKISFSKEFAAAAADLDKAVGAASTNATVSAATAKASAATTPEAKAAAGAEVDAALGGAKAKLAAAAAVATTPGDKIKLGELTRNVGVLMADSKMQHQGLVQMLDSGATAPDSVGQIRYLAGVTAYQSGDYVGAANYLKQAKDGGYTDKEGMIDRVLADAYKRSGNTAAALGVATQEIAAARAAGTKPSEIALRSALQAAYDAKQVNEATSLAVDLARDYPTSKSWASSIAVVRALAGLQGQDNLDLMRLMSRTGSMDNKRDYLEYIENADPRRLPGETLKIMDQGVASGQLTSGEVAEYRQVASGRLAADKASLVSLERDARNGSASAATVTGAADAFLSYGEPAKAEELYKAALAKSGVDKDRAMTRLGIAQVDQGKFAEAKQSFSQVGGTRGPVAKLWSAYADSKSAPSAPATASAAQ